MCDILKTQLLNIVTVNILFVSWEISSCMDVPFGLEELLNDWSQNSDILPQNHCYPMNKSSSEFYNIL